MPGDKAAPEKSWPPSYINGEREMDTAFLLHLLATLLGMMRSAQRANITKGNGPHGNDRTVAQDALWTERECCRQLCNAVWPALSGWNRTCAAVPLHCTRSESACLLGSSTFIRIRGNRRGDFSAVGTGSNLHSPTVFCCPLERTRVTKIHIDCQEGK